MFRPRSQSKVVRTCPKKGRRTYAKKNGSNIHQCQERNGEKDINPGGKTLVKGIWKVWC